MFRRSVPGMSSSPWGLTETVASATGSPEPLRRTTPARDEAAPNRMRTSFNVIPAPTTTRPVDEPHRSPSRAETR